MPYDLVNQVKANSQNLVPFHSFQNSFLDQSVYLFCTSCFQPTLGREGRYSPQSCARHKSLRRCRPGGNCRKIGLPGKSILVDYFQENRTSRRPFLLLRIGFPKRPIFIQFIPGGDLGLEAAHVVRPEEELPVEVAHVDGVLGGNSKDFKSHSKKITPKIALTGFYKPTLGAAYHSQGFEDKNFNRSPVCLGSR